ncbi:MAG: hypothetical protein ACOY5V_05095 [Pseudomonadota bacterium]
MTWITAARSPCETGDGPATGVTLRVTQRPHRASRRARRGLLTAVNRRTRPWRTMSMSDRCGGARRKTMPASTSADARWSDAAEVEAAIASVLEAERAAGAAVEACAAQAQARVQHARDRARAIAERAAQRTARVRHVCAAQLAARLAAIEHERQALARGTDADPADLQRMQAAIDELADALAGGEHRSPSGAP